MAPWNAEGTDEQVGLTEAEAQRRLAQYGRNEIPEKVTPWYVILGRQFAGPMPFMIFAAALLSLVIACIEPVGGPWPDFGICTFMLLMNAGLGFREQLHADHAAQALKEKVMPECSVKRDGENRMIDARELVPGDIVFLKAGQVVPADSDWLSGDPMGIDNAALNGESVVDKVFERRTEADPASKVGNELRGKSVWSAAQIKTGGGSNCVVRLTGTNTMIGQAAVAMQQGRPGKAMFQQTVEKMVKCVIAAALIFVVVLLIVQLAVRGRAPLETLLACVSVLIGSVPVALPVVLTVTLALGSSKMAGEGAIVTNLSSLQEVAVMRILCSDKTGTLTTAKMTVYPNRIWCAAADFTQDLVLTFAGLSSNADNVEDPIDSGVLRACKEHFAKKAEKGTGLPWEEHVKKYAKKRFIGFDPSTKRVCAFYEDKETGKCYQIGKGLLGKVLDAGEWSEEADVIMSGGGNFWTCENLAQVSAAAKAEDKKLATEAFKTISVCVREGTGWETDAQGMVTLKGAGPMRFMGVLPMRDPPRADTAPTVRNIRDAGVEVKMITGDHHDIAVKTSEQINLGSEIYARERLYMDADMKVLDDALIRAADGFAQVVPTDKYNVIKSLQAQGYIVGMTGDGVNDAAALSAANCGIAVKGAVDAARAASDILLTDGGLSPIYSAIYESRCIFQRLRSYVVYRIGVSIYIVAVLAILILGFDYVLDPLYVILMALFNDIAITMIGFDRAVPSSGPSVPRTSTMLALAFAAGCVQTAATIIMFYFGHRFLQNDSGATGVAPADFGRPHWQDGSGNGGEYIASVLFLQMESSCGLCMMMMRTRRMVLLGSRPDWRLITAVCSAFVASVLLDGFKTIGQKIAWADVGIIVAYNLGVVIVIEAVKVAIITLMPEDPSDRECCAGPQELEQNVSLENDDEEQTEKGGLLGKAPMLTNYTGAAEPGLAGVKRHGSLRPPSHAGSFAGSMGGKQGSVGSRGVSRAASLRASLTGNHQHVPRTTRDSE